MKTLVVTSIVALALFPLLANCSSSLSGESMDEVDPDAAPSNQNPPESDPDPDCEPNDDVCVPVPDSDPSPDPDPDPTPDPDPSPVEVPLFIVGDCVTAACPAATPYPVGCNVIFSQGDDRGCVASTPDKSAVYFQAGDKCNQGLILGTLYCSATPGPALNLATCPINKPVPMHVASSAMCPATN